MPDAIELLTQQHRQAEQIINQALETSEQPEQRAELLEQAVTMLRAHMVLEETTFYPFVQEALGEEAEELLQESLVEHQLARNGVEQLVVLMPDAPGIDGAITIVRDGVLHHVREEEQELFPMLRERAGERLQEVGEQMEQQLQELMEQGPEAIAEAAGAEPQTAMSGTGTSDLSEKKKEELVEMAKEAGIGGASGMKKDELIEKLSEQG